MGTAPESSHSDDRRRPPGIPEQLAGAGCPGRGCDCTFERSHRGARRQPRQPRASPPSSAGRGAEVRKTIKKPRQENAAPSRRPELARAGESTPRPRPGAAARGGHVGRGTAESPPGTPRRPPPRTHQRLRPLGERAAASQLASAGAALPKPGPAPLARRGRAPHAELHHGPQPGTPAPPRPRILQAPSCRSGAQDGPPCTAHAYPRRLCPQTAAEIPERALPTSETTSPGRRRAGPRGVAAWG